MSNKLYFSKQIKESSTMNGGDDDGKDSTFQMDTSSPSTAFNKERWHVNEFEKFSTKLEIKLKYPLSKIKLRASYKVCIAF
jgi:hypothetical protein